MESYIPQTHLTKKQQNQDLDPRLKKKSLNQYSPECKIMIGGYF